LRPDPILSIALPGGDGSAGALDQIVGVTFTKEKVILFLAFSLE
jgi:hypothetical protein